MSQIYESMLKALQDHWKANGNAYPQRFELTQVDLDALVAHRKVINEAMNFGKVPNLGAEFHGVKVVPSEQESAMVAADGQRVPLAL